MKAVNLDISKEDTKIPLQRIQEIYNTMKKLGEEHPYFIRAIDINEIKLKNVIRIETLTEYGGQSLDKLMHSATKEEIKKW